MKKKILQIITLAECGGAQTHLLEIVQGLKQDFKFAVALGERGFLTDELQKLEIPFFIIPSLVRSISPIKDLKAVIEISSLIKQFKPDLIHCHSSKAGIVGRLAAFANKTASVFTAHGWAFHPKVKFIQRNIALFSEIICSFISKKIICVSDYDHKLAVSTHLISKNKLITIHNGIADMHLSKQKNIISPKILIVCRFAEPKRPEILIEAFSKISNQFQSELWLIGEGPSLEACKDLSKSLNLEEKVKFFGQVYPLGKFFEEVSVFCLISDREGLPISIIEAMRAGLPVLASQVGGITEMVEDGINGFLIENNQVGEVAQKLQLLLSDELLQKKFSSKARETFEKKFSNQIMLSKLNSLYISFLS